ncbi:hypothetical protein CE206_28670 (plasmid) [Achromobacter xylosoxidans]|uniref:DUF2165 family protein n=1 Tax=Alcaligenes xylosoxydans xylosoxydans TaxID=85698 RepID=UPI000DD1123B|nr:DUF2165 domain-containing protein [Achromobacter xylosoxidans]AXA80557.1 hypothetical protein CE206_28670 [Achromobacter xylosoxidans]
MTATRISKAMTVLAAALFATLVTVNNITDYRTNFMFVQHVFMMDTTFPGNNLMYRAITSPTLHHIGYIFIIALEMATAILCWIGGVRLLLAAKATSVEFRRAKIWAIYGLTLGFLTWQVGFMTVGGQWFGMWMSQTWNGVESAFRFFITLLAILIYITLPNDD